MTRTELKKAGWALFDIPDMTQIGIYAGWDVFINFADVNVFYAIDSFGGNCCPVRASCLRDIQAKIDGAMSDKNIKSGN